MNKSNDLLYEREVPKRQRFYKIKFCDLRPVCKSHKHTIVTQTCDHKNTKTFRCCVSDCPILIREE